MKHRPECDFTQTNCQPFFLDGEASAKHGVLLLHGFTGTIAHMRPLAEALQKNGFTVMGINLPGHCTSMDDMAKHTWEDWLNAAKDAMMELKSRCEYVSVAGLSMGGCLSLLIGESMQPTAIATISAPMGTRAPLWAAALASPFIKTVWWHARQEENVLDSKYDIGYPGFRSTCARQLSRLIRLSRRDLYAIQCPILVIQSHADDTITADSARVILSGVSSERKGMLWLDGVPHVCTISREMETIAQAMTEHFRWAEMHQT